MRRVLLVAVLVAGVVASAAPAASRVRVASGVFGHVSWTLLAQDSNTGSFCITLKLGGVPTSTCDKLDLSGTRGLSYVGHPGRPGPDYWAGPITSKAKRVVVTYPDRKRISAPTFPPPSGLARNISFYAVFTPCRTARPTRIAGEDARGRIVASSNTLPERAARNLTC